MIKGDHLQHILSWSFLMLLALLHFGQTGFQVDVRTIQNTFSCKLVYNCDRIQTCVVNKNLGTTSKNTRAQNKIILCCIPTSEP